MPENKRKIILWSVVIILGLILFIGWVRSFQESLRKFSEEKIIEEFKAPLLERFQDMPRIEIPKIEISEIEIPEITEEEWKQLEEELSKEELEELKKWLEEMKK